jgi:hypothetical protein
MKKRKININKKAKDWKDRYPMVEVISSPLAELLETLQSNMRP